MVKHFANAAARGRFVSIAPPVLSSLWGFTGGRDSGLVVRDLPAHTEGEEEINCWFAPTINPQLQERVSSLTCPANTLGMALQEVKQQHDIVKAVKADDATVPIHWWHVRVLGYMASAADTRVLTTIQDFVLRCYRRRLQRECISFLVRAHGTDWARKGERGLANVTAMQEIVWRTLNNVWFEFSYTTELHLHPPSPATLRHHTFPHTRDSNNPGTHT